VVRVTSEKRSVDELAAELRAGDPPLFTRIHEGALMLDPRTLLPGESEQVLSAFRDLK
jgi:L-seryl-tRNA(Ser) seleniumtransferase